MVTFVLSLSVMALISLEEFCNVFSNLGLSDFFFFFGKVWVLGVFTRKTVRREMPVCSRHVRHTNY